MDKNIDIINEWLNDPVEKIKEANWLYRFICFCFMRKLTYKEVYLILYGLNRNKMGEEKSKKLAMLRILQIYKDLHNGDLPKGVKL